MNSAKLFEIRRKIDEGYYTNGDVPDDVLDLIAAEINAEESAGQPDPAITLAACCVLIPSAGYGLLCLAAWIWG